jgi:hypothetical protein
MLPIRYEQEYHLPRHPSIAIIQGYQQLTGRLQLNLHPDGQTTDSDIPCDRQTNNLLSTRMNYKSHDRQPLTNRSLVRNPSVTNDLCTPRVL